MLFSGVEISLLVFVPRNAGHFYIVSFGRAIEYLDVLLLSHMSDRYNCILHWF